MAFARPLLKGDRKERAILRRADNEQCYGEGAGRWVACSLRAPACLRPFLFLSPVLAALPIRPMPAPPCKHASAAGVQIATNQISEGVRAGEAAAEAGADWLDLNVGCPIYEATRRGLGAALLRKPAKLAKLVRGGAGGWVGGSVPARPWRRSLQDQLSPAAEPRFTPCTAPPSTPRQVNGIALQSPLPLTVKIRLGESASKINVEEVVGLLERAGAAAVTIHGRWGPGSG